LQDFTVWWGCSWGLRSSAIWWCINGLLVPDVSIPVCCPEISGTNHPAMQRHTKKNEDVLEPKRPNDANDHIQQLLSTDLLYSLY